MNDPFVLDQAGFWADRLLARTVSMEARIESLFRTALGRLPDPAESEEFQGLVKELEKLHEVEDDQVFTSREVWKDMAHLVFNLKEFIYTR